MQLLCDSDEVIRNNLSQTPAHTCSPSVSPFLQRRQCPDSVSTIAPRNWVPDELPGVAYPCCWAFRGEGYIILRLHSLTFVERNQQFHSTQCDPAFHRSHSCPQRLAAVHPWRSGGAQLAEMTAFFPCFVYLHYPLPSKGADGLLL